MLVEMENVSVRYGRVLALEDVTLNLNGGYFLVVMGPNGAGKTTLLRVIAGLVAPSSGTVRVLGRDPLREGSEVRSLIGYVPQRQTTSTAVPMRVIDVVLMGVLVGKRPPRIPEDADVEAALDSLELVGMRQYKDELFRNLSSGQQQRVLIARALSRRPSLLLLDEPLNGVDVASQRVIIEAIEALKRERRVGIIMVTHDVNPVVDSMDTMILLNRRVIAAGPPELVLNERVLSEAYGSRIRVLTHEGKCYAIVGDTHG